MVTDASDFTGFRLNLRRGEKTLSGKPLQLKTHLDKKKISEVMFRQNMPCPGKFPLGIHVCFAKLCLIHGNSRLSVGTPYDFAPMVAAGVKRAAVIENYTFYFHIAYLFNCVWNDLHMRS